MQGEFYRRDSPGGNILKDALREMQSRRRCRHGTVDPGIHGLVTCPVSFLRLPVQVGWDGGGARLFEDLAEGNPGRFPVETDQESILFPPGFFSKQADRFSMQPDFLLKRALLPLPGVAHQAFP